MEFWQLTLVILASVLTGALVPLLVLMTIVFYRVGKEVAALGEGLAKTLTHVETISDRVEVLSRGFKGGETDIADLLTSVGSIARCLERNMKIINVFSTILATVKPAIVAFIKTRFSGQESAKHTTPDVVVVPGNGHPSAELDFGASRHTHSVRSSSATR